MGTSTRAFVLHRTRLRPVPGVDGIRLHLADEVLPLWHDVQVETGDPDAPLPYWAFAWGGGLALARYLQEHPETVRGRRVFDFASGSGLCAIAALHAGAAHVTAADIDPLAAAAIRLNARANRFRIDIVEADVLDDAIPDTDIVLAGDCWYDATLAGRIQPWIERLAAAEIETLIGDPGRRYLPRTLLRELACYDVRTTTELEDLDLKRGCVYTLDGGHR